MAWICKILFLSPNIATTSQDNPSDLFLPKLNFKMKGVAWYVRGVGDKTNSWGDSHIPGLCYELLAENAELRQRLGYAWVLEFQHAALIVRKMCNAYQLKVLLLSSEELKNARDRAVQLTRGWHRLALTGRSVSHVLKEGNEKALATSS